MIMPGTFRMGEANRLPDSMKFPPYLAQGDWDEHPVRKVKISRSFKISETEITVEQYRQFDPELVGHTEWAPYVSGISWYDAVAFCEWLSRKKVKTYRLPESGGRPFRPIDQYRFPRQRRGDLYRLRSSGPRIGALEKLRQRPNLDRPRRQDGRKAYDLRPPQRRPHPRPGRQELRYLQIYAPVYFEGRRKNMEDIFDTFCYARLWPAQDCSLPAISRAPRESSREEFKDGHVVRRSIK